MTSVNSTNKESKKLSVGQMLAVGTAEFFGGGIFNIINFLYPVFLVMAVGLPPALSGVAILIARITDGIIDPPIGLLSDKLRVRLGSRRKTLFVSAPLLVLALFLLFFPYSNPSVSVRFFLVLASYVFFVIVQSSVMIPYYSLASEITDDYTERTRMTTVRLAFSITASIICVAVPGIIVDAFKGEDGTGTGGYIVMSLTFGFIFMVLILVTAIFAREGISEHTIGDEQKLGGLRVFLRPLKLKVFRQYLYVFLCCQMTMAVMSTLFFFYIDFYFCRDLTARGEGNIVGIIGAALMFGMQIFALPFYLAMSKRVGKMAVYILGSAIWIVGALILFLVPAGINPLWLYILAMVLGFGISGPGLIPHAILPDVIDVGSLKYGTRTSGSFSGLANMIIQIGQAVGVSVVMVIIGAAGFVEQQIGAPPLRSQPESAQQAIIMIMALAPLLLMSYGIFISTRYRLGSVKHAQVIAALDGSEDEKVAALESL